MDSPLRTKGLKQARLCFKTMSTKDSLKVSAVSKRKRKSDLPTDSNEAKTLKTSDVFNVDKCPKIIEKCKTELSHVKVVIEPLKISCDVLGNRIACDGSIIIGSEDTGCCSDDKTLNPPLSTDRVKCCIKERNCDTSLLNKDPVPDHCIISLSSSEESSATKGFSVFSSSSSNAVASTNDDKCTLKGECLEKSEKTDVVCEKSASVANNLLSQQAEPVTNQKPLRKRKKMSNAEAQLKSQQREKMMKEKEIERNEKKKELHAKMVQKQLLKEQKQKAKEELKQERQKKREIEENERKERERLKQEKKEQEEKEKQQKLLKKEEKNRLKQQLLEAKMEEKKKKEDQKIKILEEKKKTEIEEAKKFQKTKAAFVNYFLKSKSVQSPQVPNSDIEDQGMFRPFQVKDNMQLAPIIPQVARERFNKINMEQSLKNAQEKTVLYLDALKSGQHLAFKHKKTKHKKLDNSNNDDDIIMIDCKEEDMVILDLKEGEEKQIIDHNLRAKLLQFCENVRPPYWGTWRKTSKIIGPRTPFVHDDIFDYDVDSDDEWDEGGPGESLSGTEDEESEDDYEVDNEFFVPHGYLSADEENDDDVGTNNPELHRARLKMREREFESERSKKTTFLRPILVGCFWQADNVIEAACLLKPLNPFCASVLVVQPITTTHSVSQTSDSSRAQLGLDTSPVDERTSPKPLSYLSVKRPVPEEGIPYLIRLLHASTHSRQTVIKEFQEFWSLNCCKKRLDATVSDNNGLPMTTALSPASNEKLSSDKDEALVGKPQSEKISKRQLELTIQKLSTWRRCPDASMNKFCWWVHKEMLEKYGMTDLPIPNKWEYVSKKDTENTKPVSQSATPSIKTFLHP